MPVKQFQPGCQVCGSTLNLFNCGRCSAVQYCGAAHEAVDSKHHLFACSRIWEHLHAIQQCEELPLDGMLPPNSLITSLISVDDSDPLFQTPGAVRQVDRGLRNSLIDICTTQNTYASFRLAIEQIRMVARYQITSPLVFVPTFLKLGADKVCYNFLSIGRRIEDIKKEGREEGDTVVKQFYKEARKIMEKDEVGCDVFEDLRQWVFWTPMPPPRTMAALILVLQVWIEDLENLARFDRTIATYLRAKLNYDTVEVIRNYLPDSDAMSTNRKVYQDRDGKLLQELREHQDYILKASCYSSREFWYQLIHGLKSDLVTGSNVRSRRETGAIIGFPRTTEYTREDVRVFHRLLKEDASAFRFLSDFFVREPLYSGGPSSGVGWMKAWQEVSRLTTARSERLQNRCG